MKVDVSYYAVPGMTPIDRLRLEKKIYDGEGDELMMCIVDIVSRYFGISRTLMLSNSRQAELVLCRQYIFHMIRELLSFGYVRIGRKLGYNHTTVLHHVNKTNEWIRHGDKRFMEHYYIIKERCYQKVNFYEQIDPELRNAREERKTYSRLCRPKGKDELVS